MAIDREAMIPSIFFGDAVKNWSTSTPGSQALVHARGREVRLQPRRVEAAAGQPRLEGRRTATASSKTPRASTVSFTLKTNSDNTLRVGMANFIRDDLAKVGIKVTLVPVDFNTLITNLRDDFQYDAILLGLQSGVPPDPAMGQNVWRSSGRDAQLEHQPAEAGDAAGSAHRRADGRHRRQQQLRLSARPPGPRSRTSSTNRRGSSGCPPSRRRFRCATASATRSRRSSRTG